MNSYMMVSLLSELKTDLKPLHIKLPFGLALNLKHILSLSLSNAELQEMLACHPAQTCQLRDSWETRGRGHNPEIDGFVQRLYGCQKVG